MLKYRLAEREGEIEPINNTEEGVGIFFYIINKRYKYLRNNKTTVVVFLCAFFSGKNGKKNWP